MEKEDTPNIVYLVIGYTPYEGGEVFAVYKDEKKAKGYARHLKESNQERYEDYYVDRWFITR